MSNGADNFYTSDEVTVQKVNFKNQYQMRPGWMHAEISHESEVVFFKLLTCTDHV